MQMEMNQFDRKQGATEQKDMMNFVLGIAKLKQMAEKDEKSMVKDFESMDIEEQNNIMTMTANMAKIAADVNTKRMQANKQSEGGNNGGTSSASNKGANAKT